MKNTIYITGLALLLGMAFSHLATAQCDAMPGLDGSFEACAPVAGTTTPNANVNCGGWSNGFGSADTWNMPWNPGSPVFYNHNVPASPDGGVVAASIIASVDGEEFLGTVNDLLVGEIYEVRFYQVYAGAQSTDGTVRKGRWKVTFGNQTEYSSEIFATTFPQWQAQTLTFVASATTQTLSFSATKGLDDPQVVFRYLMIDGISLELKECGGGGNTGECDNDSFAPKPGEAYVVSAWVKDEVPNQVDQYQGHIELINEHTGGTQTTPFYPSGNIIDGWQQIIGVFELHENTTQLEIKLISINEGGNDTSYFDDIRVFPYHSNLRSFVYDPVTQRLMAELDENNFATFYEYDHEGGLVRVKKETERGVYTIQESRSATSKINN